VSIRLRAFPVVFLLFAASASAQTFIFHLRGDQEVPPIASTRSGGCMGTLNQGAATFAITCVHDVFDATIMHIHRGAPGVNGEVAFDLGSPVSPVNATWTGMTPQDISELLAGNLYVNIHTAGRPAGEIRGQILTRTVDLVNFTANGAQVIPPNGGSATATCSADLSGDATSLAVQCTHNVPSPQSAQIHDAPAGSNGPIVFTFPSPASPLSGNVPMTPQLVASFAATFLYLDIHGPEGTEESPGAEIRGQIGTPPSAPTAGTIRITKSTSPAGAGGFGFTGPIAPAAFTLNDGQTQTFTNVAAGTYTFTENDPSSGNHTLADVSCSDSDSTTNVAARTATVRLQAGETVECRFRNVLTSPADQLFIFHLSGDQEVPPVTTTHRGGCMGRYAAAESRLTMVCTHDVPDASVMHIHQGAPGVNGPIVFDMGSPLSPVVATWSGMTPANSADLLAGNLYVNIHTPGRPGGEIRGQLVPRTVDFVPFTMNGAQVVPPGTTSATGTCTADLNDAATSLAVQCTHNLPSPASAHVHQAPFGENGPVVFTFPSAASPLNANVPMTPRLVADFAARFLYADVHGAGSGEEAVQIRGQIGLPAPPPVTGTIRIVKQTTPAGGVGFAFTDNVPGSPGAFTLNDGGTREFTNVAAGTYTITEALPAGYTLTDVVCGDDNSVGNPFARTATVNLAGGEVVTCTFRNLRTFAAPARFVFHLSGDQEVPPVPGTARGGCMAQLNVATSELSVVCTHNVSDATVMHIHRGLPGENGPVVFDLGNPLSPVTGVWNMMPADIADLNAGRLYVNIHTGGRPAGAIRGQILPRTVDAFSFVANGAQEVPPTPSLRTGNCRADLADDASSVFVTCTHNVPSPSMTHLHAAPPGEDGPAIFDFANTSPFSGTVPLTPRLVADFAAGFLYVNIHSLPDFETGEIRGNLIGVAESSHSGEAIPTLWEWMALVMALTLLAAGLHRLR
jgi:CHRD domain/Prealbumin-like fold domain